MMTPDFALSCQIAVMLNMKVGCAELCTVSRQHPEHKLPAPATWHMYPSSIAAKDVAELNVTPA